MDRVSSKGDNKDSVDIGFSYGLEIEGMLALVFQALTSDP